MEFPFAIRKNRLWKLITHPCSKRKSNPKKQSRVSHISHINLNNNKNITLTRKLISSPMQQKMHELKWQLLLTYCIPNVVTNDSYLRPGIYQYLCVAPFEKNIRLWTHSRTLWHTLAVGGSSCLCWQAPAFWQTLPTVPRNLHCHLSF